MNNKRSLGIITPTYNRANNLVSLFESLKKQTNFDFEWIIIDDGSTDNTKQAVMSMEAAEFPISYVYKENGGKASALNNALNIIENKYCMCLDSDDTLTQNSVEIILRDMNSISRFDCCGIVGLRNNPNGDVMGGKRIPIGIEYTNIIEIYNKFKITSEFINVYFTRIAKQYRFPIIRDEKFIPPSWFHYAVASKYVFKVSQDNLMICEYQNDGLTVNKIRVIKKNPVGYTLIKKIAFQNATNISYRLRNGIMYGAGQILCGKKMFFKESPHPFLSLLLYPLSWIAFFKKFK